MSEKRPNLPENDPQAAGERILYLSQNILNNGNRHGAQVKLARSLYGEEYDSKKSKVSGWCRGKFLDESKPLKIKDFQEIVNLFWQKPGGIQTFDEVFELARCIGYIKVGTDTGNLVDLLERTWLENLGYTVTDQANNSPLRDTRYPRNTKSITRQAFLDEIYRQFIPMAMDRKQPILIFGEPGTGKTTLIDQIRIPKQLGESAEKRIFFLNGQGISEHLRVWYQELIGIEPEHRSSNADLALVISKRLAKTNVPMLILMDDVSNIESISLVLDILRNSKQFVVIATTNSPRLAHETSVPHFLQVSMPGFSAEEAETYFKIFLERKMAASEKKQFDLLVKALKGNPLGLHFALQQLQMISIEELLKLINGIDQEIPDELLREVFLPLQVGFERLPKELSQVFIRLASMKPFDLIDNKALAALLANSSQDIDFAKTKLNIELLQKFISPLQPSQDGWKLHKQTHLFAISKFKSLGTQEQAISSGWIERLSAVYEYSEPSIRQAFTVSKEMGLKIYRPAKTRSSRVQRMKNLILRSLRTLLIGHSYDWEEIQEEVTHITSYEYFISYKLQEEEKRYLRSFRIWIAGTTLFGAMLSLSEKYFSVFTVLFFVIAFIAWILYTIKMYVYDVVGFWKCLTRWQLIWNSIGKRISVENRD